LDKYPILRRHSSSIFHGLAELRLQEIQRNPKAEFQGPSVPAFHYVEGHHRDAPEALPLGITNRPTGDQTKGKCNCASIIQKQWSKGQGNSKLLLMRR
jgi:hypothetical protein